MSLEDLKSIIADTVFSFYEKAVSDFLIGYHFRKIQEKESPNPLAPPMEAFSHHIPRINAFWEIQLLGQTQSSHTNFNLIQTHLPLNLRKGELNRWLLLFRETLLEQQKLHPHQNEFLKKWEERLEVFESRFNSHLFSQVSSR